MSKQNRRPRESRDPVIDERRDYWIPAFAGMTLCNIPAFEGTTASERRACPPFVMAGLDPAIQGNNGSRRLPLWIAASSAAMTKSAANLGRRACR
jgi:hypothetical protein